MTDQENTTIIGDDEIIGDEIEESEQGGNGAHNREVKRRRRLTPEETRILSEIYEHTQKPNSVLRNRLAQELGMSSRQIQIWFQNRRAKIKRDVNDPLGTDSASKLYYASDPAHPYYIQYPPGTISNNIQSNATRPIGMLNIASKPILPMAATAAAMNGIYPPKQYPMDMTQQMNAFQIPVTTMNYTNQTQSAVQLQPSQQGGINYGYTLRSQGVQSSKPLPIQNSYIQSTTAGPTRNIQRIIPGNSVVQMQQQQPIRTAGQLATSPPVPPMYTQPSTQVPIYTTAPNPANYAANGSQIQPLQNMPYPGQKAQPVNSRNPIYMNQMNYPAATQGSPPLASNNMYISNVYDINKRTPPSTTMVYNQNVIPATNIVNSGIPSTVTLAPNSSAVITPSPLSRSVSNLPNQMNKMVQNQIMMSPDNKADLAKKVPITTMVSTMPAMPSLITNQPYPTNISKLASTGMPTSPIKAIINSSINSKIATKTAAAMKQENAMNQNAALYNINNNMAIPTTINSDKMSNPAVAPQQPNVGIDKSTTAPATTAATTIPASTTAQAPTSNVEVATTSTTTIPVSTNKNDSSLEKPNENKEKNNEKGDETNNNIANPLTENKNEVNTENKNIDVLNTDDITKIDNADNINILDSMLYDPKTKISEAGDLPLISDNDLDPSKDQSNKFLKDLDSLYDNNDTMKWLEDDTSWNQATQLSQFPLPVEDKKNQKENESKDLGSVTDLNTNDDSFNDNNNQLWLSDDIDYLLQSENFQV